MMLKGKVQNSKFNVQRAMFKEEKRRDSQRASAFFLYSYILLRYVGKIFFIPDHLYIAVRLRTLPTKLQSVSTERHALEVSKDKYSKNFASVCQHQTSRLRGFKR